MLGSFTHVVVRREATQIWSHDQAVVSASDRGAAQ